MRLKSIHTQHIQSHEDVLVELPESGVVAFVGNNSNGKSVIVKVTNAILSGKISNPKVRRTLITRGRVAGLVIYEAYEGYTLRVQIHQEAAQTWAELKHPNGEVTKRFLSDKSIGELVALFGFHYNKEHEVSLNLHNDDDRLLFVDTKHTTNYSCLTNTLGDEYAEASLLQLNQALFEIKERIKKCENGATTYKAARNALTMCDIPKATEIRDICYVLANVLQHFITEPCPKVEGVPNVVTIASFVECPKVTYPTVVNLPTEFPDLIMEGRDVNDVLKGVCPTCKREFFS